MKGDTDEFLRAFVYELLEEILKAFLQEIPVISDAIPGRFANKISGDVHKKLPVQTPEGISGRIFKETIYEFLEKTNSF